MKTLDRIFVAALVVVICLSGIYAVKSFSKGREAINVVGEGQVEVAPNEVKIQLNAIYSGVESEATQKFDQEVKSLESQLSSQGRTLKKTDKNFIDKRENYTPSCYARDFEIKAPCLDGYLILQATGDNIMERAKKVVTFLENKKNWDVKYADLSVNNSEAIVKEARELALKNAKEQAKSTAKTLGVGLGRLLQTTEYKIDERGYGDDQNTYVYTQHFYGSDALNFDGMNNLKIIRKAYLTYDIN